MSKENKPKTDICDKCFVVNNVLRCQSCKYKTMEWLAENLKSCMLIADADGFKPKKNEEQV